MSGLDAINGLNSVEKYYAMELASEALKANLGDGMEFEIVYQALLDSMKNDTSTNKDEASVLDLLSTMNAQGSLDSASSVGYADANSYYNSIINALKNNTNNTSANVSEKIMNAVNKYSKEYGVDSNLLLAVINQESAGNANALSSAGAQGLMQLMPATSEAMGVTNPYDVDDNIMGGTKLLSTLLNKYDNNTAMALMAYNAGEGTMKTRGVTSENDLYKMPSETINYVTNILKNYSKGE